MVMKNRMQAFERLQTHAWYAKVYRSLSSSERAIALNFLEINQSLTSDDFELALNRMFLNVPPEIRPKRWTTIQELLSACNSASRRAS